jgi:tetratricopeptide (TPR) repeat protein
MASVQALVERAERCVDTFELPLALKFYEKALALEPENCALLDASGELLMQLDEAERAIAVLQKSVALEPDGNFATWTNLGQLLGGAAAVQCFDKGIGLLRTRERALRKRTTKGAAGAEARQELCTTEQNICAALSAIAEVSRPALPSTPRAAGASERLGESTVRCISDCTQCSLLCGYPMPHTSHLSTIYTPVADVACVEHWAPASSADDRRHWHGTVYLASCHLRSRSAPNLSRARVCRST